jgi:hypothetical protein
VTSVVRRISSADTSSMAPNTVVIAELTHTSIGPSASSTADAAASTAEASATSHGTTTARTP